MNATMKISRRRLLGLTAAGVSVAAIGGLRGLDRAYAADEKPYPHLELWEDASRLPVAYQPENYEWWYFDATLADGSTVVFEFHIDQDWGEHKYLYRAVAVVTRPNGQSVAGEYRTYKDVSISHERPEVRFGKNFLRGDLDTYRVVMDESELGKLGFDFTIRRACPSRVSPANRNNILQGDKILGWVNAVPRGELTGTLTVNGERAAVKGVAYHDHNWGNAPMGSLLNRWIWYRAAIGPYTAVFWVEYPNQAYAHGRTDGIQELFIASEGAVLLNVEGPGAARVTAPTAPNPDPRNAFAYYCPSVSIEAEQNGRRVTLQADAGKLILSQDLATQSKFLSPAELARAAQMEHKPWYSRFVAAPVTLSVAEEGKTQTYSGEGVIEFMDFHLNL